MLIQLYLASAQVATLLIHKTNVKQVKKMPVKVKAA